MEYSNEKREKTSISVRPSLWEAFDRERLRRGYTTASNALEDLLAEWVEGRKGEATAAQDIEARRQLEELLLDADEAQTIRDLIDTLYKAMQRRR